MSLIISNVVNNVNTPVNFTPRVTVMFLLLDFLRSYNCVTHMTFVVSHFFHRFNVDNGDFVPLLVSTNYNMPNVVTSHAVRGRASHHLAVVAAAFVPYNTGLPIVTLLSNTVVNNS